MVRDSRPLTWLSGLARLGVALMCGLAVVLALLCHFGPTGHVLWVLLVYTPLPFLCIPAVMALWVSMWLRPVWRWMALASLVLLLTVVMGLVWGHADEGEGRVRLMTYNAKVSLALARPGGLASLAMEVAAQDPDIVVMQDAGEFTAYQADHPEAQRAMFGEREVYAQGQYIVASRFPLKGCKPGSIPFRKTPHSFVQCEVQVGARRLNLVTVHFITPRQGLNAFRHEGLKGLAEWQQNVSDRTQQAVELAEQVKVLRASGLPLVVAGDLNAPERSEVVRLLLNAGLRDAFSSAGWGYGYTHGHSLRLGLSFLRIDHVLVSEDMGVAQAQVGGALGSEHRPVVADLFMHRR